MAVRIEHLRKQYAAPDGSVLSVIDIPSFAMTDREQVALVGTSGSGKTTLLHLLAGIVVADDGEIVYTLPDGQWNLAAMSEAKRDVFRGRHIGYIFQTHHLLAGFTALENVMLGMSFTGRKVDRAWVQHLLEAVGLKDRLHYKPQKLSVGQQQRVAVARALANRPSLVLADEPTGSLDVRSAQQTLDLIRGLCEEAGSSLLMVSHDPKLTSQLPRSVELSELNRAGRTETAVVAGA